jgi:uncharacterized membrane protein
LLFLSKSFAQKDSNYTTLTVSLCPQMTQWIRASALSQFQDLAIFLLVLLSKSILHWNFPQFWLLSANSVRMEEQLSQTNPPWAILVKVFRFELVQGCWRLSFPGFLMVILIEVFLV